MCFHLVVNDQRRRGRRLLEQEVQNSVHHRADYAAGRDQIGGIGGDYKGTFVARNHTLPDQVYFSAEFAQSRR